MHKSAVVIFLGFFLLSTVLSGCGGSDTVEKVTPAPEPPTPEPVLDHSGLTAISIDVIDKSEYLSGGDATVFVSNENAFSRKPALIIDDFQLDGFFTQGDHLFRTPDDDIGPILSTGSCQGCHLNDGRGVVPATPTTPMSSMLVKLANGKGEADPMYGDQIQPFSIHGFMDGNALSAGFSKHDGSVSGVQLYGEAFPFIVLKPSLVHIQMEQLTPYVTQFIKYVI